MHKPNIAPSEGQVPERKSKISLVSYTWIFFYLQVKLQSSDALFPNEASQRGTSQQRYDSFFQHTVESRPYFRDGEGYISVINRPAWLSTPSRMLDGSQEVLKVWWCVQNSARNSASPSRHTAEFISTRNQKTPIPLQVIRPLSSPLHRACHSVRYQFSSTSTCQMPTGYRYCAESWGYQDK